MSLYDPASLEAMQQHTGTAADKGLDVTHDAVDGISQRRTAAGIKSTAARAAFSTEAVEIGGLDGDAPGHREEPGEAIGERVDIGIMPVPAGESAVEHPLGGEADHLDQPVDDDSLAANRQAVAASQVSGTTPR